MGGAPCQGLRDAVLAILWESSQVMDPSSRDAEFREDRSENSSFRERREKQLRLFGVHSPDHASRRVPRVPVWHASLFCP